MAYSWRQADIVGRTTNREAFLKYHVLSDRHIVATVANLLLFFVVKNECTISEIVILLLLRLLVQTFSSQDPAKFFATTLYYCGVY